MASMDVIKENITFSAVVKKKIIKHCFKGEYVIQIHILM